MNKSYIFSYTTIFNEVECETHTKVVNAEEYSSFLMAVLNAVSNGQIKDIASAYDYIYRIDTAINADNEKYEDEEDPDEAMYKDLDEYYNAIKHIDETNNCVFDEKTYSMDWWSVTEFLERSFKVYLCGEWYVSENGAITKHVNN